MGVEDGYCRDDDIRYDFPKWEEHIVNVNSYYIGETEVTQALWKAVMNNNPSYFQGDDLPVETVSYNDIVNSFLPELNKLTGRHFRLPSEAEWEWAARGGNIGNGYEYSGSNSIDSVCWYWKNCGDVLLAGDDDDWNWEMMRDNHCQTRPVKLKRANELGIYDMSGNVWEMCCDWYDYDSKEYYDGLKADNPKPTDRSFLLLRGGSWSDYSKTCRVYRRHYHGNTSKYNNYGFRLVITE